MSAATACISLALFFPGSYSSVLTFYLGSSFQLIWPPCSHQSLPSDFFFSPSRCLPNLPNAMLLNFFWTRGRRQPHPLVTHWLTRVHFSGLFSSHIIQGFPPCTLGVTPLHFSSSAAHRGASVHTAHIEKQKWQSHPVIVTQTFLSLFTAGVKSRKLLCLWVALQNVTLPLTLQNSTGHCCRSSWKHADVSCIRFEPVPKKNKTLQQTFKGMTLTVSKTGDENITAANLNSSQTNQNIQTLNLKDRFKNVITKTSI